MGNIFQHHELGVEVGSIQPGCLMDAISGEAAWGKNALQTLTIARHYPRDPQQAIGHRGVVDYTSGQQTTDLTLDCILTEQTDEAVEGATGGGTSIYRFAEDQMVIGTESYVLTSCNIGFTAGAPATVSYGYITAGAGSALIRRASAVEVLRDGEESYFAVVMGDDGSGVELMAKDGAGDWVNDPDDIILPSGVQSLNFACTVNKDNIMDIRSAQPIYFVTTYPIDVTVDVETYDKSVPGSFQAGSLRTIGVKLKGLSNHATRTGYTAPSRSPYANFSASTKALVMAMGLTKVEETEALNVGGYLTYTYNYMAADLAIPLVWS